MSAYDARPTFLEIKSVGWFFAGVVVALGFLSIPLQVAHQRQKLTSVETKISTARQDIFKLEVKEAILTSSTADVLNSAPVADAVCTYYLSRTGNIASVRIFNPARRRPPLFAVIAIPARTAALAGRANIGIYTKSTAGPDAIFVPTNRSEALYRNILEDVPFSQDRISTSNNGNTKKIEFPSPNWPEIFKASVIAQRITKVSCGQIYVWLPAHFSIVQDGYATTVSSSTLYKVATDKNGVGIFYFRNPEDYFSSFIKNQALNIACVLIGTITSLLSSNMGERKKLYVTSCCAGISSVYILIGIYSFLFGELSITDEVTNFIIGIIGLAISLLQFRKVTKLTPPPASKSSHPSP